jgi:hypothetical protein
VQGNAYFQHILRELPNTLYSDIFVIDAYGDFDVASNRQIWIAHRHSEPTEIPRKMRVTTAKERSATIEA